MFLCKNLPFLAAYGIKQLKLRKRVVALLLSYVRNGMINVGLVYVISCLLVNKSEVCNIKHGLCRFVSASILLRHFRAGNLKIIAFFLI